MQVRERIASDYGMEELPVRSIVSNEIIRQRKVIVGLLELQTPRGKKEEWEAAQTQLAEGDVQGAIQSFAELGAKDALLSIGEVYRQSRPEIAMEAFIAGGKAEEAIKILLRFKNADEETLRWLMNKLALSLR